MKTFQLNSEFIELNKLLKLMQLTETGGQAKNAIADGLVKVNGVSEYQFRKKIRKGDVVEFEGSIINIE